MGFPGRPPGQHLPGGGMESWPHAGHSWCWPPPSPLLPSDLWRKEWRPRNFRNGEKPAVQSPEGTHIPAQGDIAPLSLSKGSGRQSERKGRRLGCLSNIWKWVIRGGGRRIGGCQGESESTCWRSCTTPPIWVSACGWTQASSLVFV